MTLRSGTRLKSQVDTTELIVVRAPADDLGLRCGGHPMVDLAAAPAVGLVTEGSGSGGLLGKRYCAPGRDDFEVLVTKSGTAGLTLDDTPLEVKAAKPLPASD